MADQLSKCPACDGRGYFRCACWPGDCICAAGDEDCVECGGEGVIDDSYDDTTDCDCSNYETDLLDGSARCHRCGRRWALSTDDIAAEVEHQAAYLADEAEADATTRKTPAMPNEQTGGTWSAPVRLTEKMINRMIGAGPWGDLTRDELADLLRSAWAEARYAAPTAKGAADE